MTLAIAFAVLVAATLGLLLFPLVRHQPLPAPRAAFDRAIYRDRMAEIDRDLERGVICEAEAEASRIEIQRRMLSATREDEGPADARPPARSPRWVALAVLVLVPAGGLALYSYLGSPGVPDYPFASRPAPLEAAHSQDGGASMEQAVERLAQRLRDRPDDLSGWQLLARTYGSMQRYEDAAGAYRQALAASNNRPDIAADYAEVLIVIAGSTVTLAAREILEAAFAADPLNPKTRFYLGLAMAERGELQNALQAWTDLVELSPDGAPWLPSVTEQIKSVAGELGIDAAAIRPSVEAERLAATLPEAERDRVIHSMVEQLAQRLKDNQNDPEGWSRLARAYEVLGETEKAKEARDRAGQTK